MVSASPPQRPYSVGIYGIDGAGKSTQVGRLIAALIERRYNAEKVLTASTIRDEAHRIAWEAGHVNAFELFDPEVLAVVAGLEVIGDLARIFRSGAPRRALVFEKYVPTWAAVVVAHGGTITPRLTAVFEAFPRLDREFFIDADPEATHRRIVARDGHAVGVEELGYQQRYRAAMDAEIARRPWIVRLDAAQPQDALAAYILERVTADLQGDGPGHERDHDRQRDG